MTSINPARNVSILSLFALLTSLSGSVLAGTTPSGCEDLSGIAEIPEVDFATEIQPILNTCTGCHGATGQAGLDLRPSESYNNLVGVIATTNPARFRIEPFNPDNSVLLLAINCQNPGGPSFQMGNLAVEDRALIRDWINQGAHPEPTQPSIPANVVLEPVFAQGTFAAPLGLINAGDGSDRLFVVQQAGAIRYFETPAAHQLFMNISDRLTSGGERGLLGLAFHPNFSVNGLFYVNYSAGSGHPSGAATGDTVISEFAIDPITGLGDPTSERVLMTVHQDFTNHNGGNIKFGPDGYLYIGMGDGGSGNDPCNRSQTLDPNDLETGPFNCTNNPPDSAALLGKMLRIDVDNTTPTGANNLCAANPDGSAEYAIPADNPWAGDNAICAETWSWGLRNPWRWSFDRDNGDMWIADVGQNTWEEVNLEPAGTSDGPNYGWKICEGSFLRGSSTQPCPLESSVLPVLEYQTGSNCSITGGYRYRGPVPSLQGTYIYGDYCTGRIWFASQVGPNDFEALEYSVEGFDLRSFGEDEQGHVYVVRSGGIWRFAEIPPVLNSVDPVTGPESGGTTLTLTGEAFVNGASVTVGGNNCLNIAVTSDTTISCQTPAGQPGSVDITVENPGGLSDTLTDAFTYIAAPTVLSVMPDSGPESGGTIVTISGEDFVDGATISFNGAACTLVDVNEPDSITCTTPAGDPGPADVTVTNPDSQTGTLVNAFNYIAAPQIQAIDPDSGPAVGGTPVTISGEHFVDGASVTFDAVNCAAINVVDDTTITCEVPAGSPGSVDIVVENPDGQSGILVDGYTYEAAPVIHSVNPDSGPAAGGTAVTITGEHFVDGASVTFDAVNCAAINVVDDDTITCEVPAGSPGSVDIVVENPDGQSSILVDGYTYVAAPVIHSVNPDSGPDAGGTPVIISGEHFVDGASVTFDGTACENIDVTGPESISCNTPAGTPGFVDVTVVNPDDQSATLVDGFRYFSELDEVFADRFEQAEPE